MQIVIERLRASKKEMEAKDEAEGRDRGREWAMESAQHKHLQRLAEIGSMRRDYNGDLSSFVEQLVFCDAGQDEWDDDHPEYFWEDHSGLSIPTDNKVRGFVNGALAVWKEVADKI